MIRYPIYFDGSIPLEDIANALAQIHVHLRTDSAGRMNAETVPRMLRRDPANVVRLDKAKRRVR